jgi:hypothetical protein
VALLIFDKFQRFLIQNTGTNTVVIVDLGDKNHYFLEKTAIVQCSLFIFPISNAVL